VESDHLNAYSSALILSIEDEGGRRSQSRTLLSTADEVIE
jgi:hypothetical protein